MNAKAAIAPVIVCPLPKPAAWRQIVQRKRCPRAATISRQIWQTRSLIIQVKYGNFHATDSLLLSLTPPRETP